MRQISIVKNTCYTCFFLSMEILKGVKIPKRLKTIDFLTWWGCTFWCLWWWFIVVDLSRTTLGFISHKLSLGYLQNGIYWAHFQTKSHGKVFFQVCPFKVFFSNTIFTSIFSIYCPLICIMFLFHSIQYIWIQFHNLNSIQFELHAKSFNIFIWMELDFYKINPIFLSIDHH